MQKKTKRTLAYAGIIGGCAVLALTFFTISQYEKAKYQASVTIKLLSKSKINKDLLNSTKAIITKSKDGEDLNAVLSPIGLTSDDFSYLDAESSDDVEAGLLKLHAPIYAVSGDDAEQVQQRYSLAAPIFGSSLATRLADKGSEENWWILVFKDFTDITNQNSAAYVGTAIPAYTFSMATLVAFGLVLKHAEKTKEKEEKEV